MAKEHTLDGSTGDSDDSHAQDDTHTLPMPKAAHTMVILPMASSVRCDVHRRQVQRARQGGGSRLTAVRRLLSRVPTASTHARRDRLEEGPCLASCIPSRDTPGATSKACAPRSPRTS